MLDAASVIARARPEAQFVIPLAPGRLPAEAEAIINQANRNGSLLPDSLRLAEQETREALAAADAAAVASGTATLEAALIGTPLVVVYKESKINWHILGRLINTEHFGLVNLIAGKRLATELMQHDLNGERLAQELIELLDPERNQAMRTELRRAAARLGPGGASERAAATILKALSRWKEQAED
jgi:lipid-A-disaccharide synthase